MDEADEPFSDDNSASNNTTTSSSARTQSFPRSYAYTNGRPHLRFSDPLPQNSTPPRSDFDFGASFSTATSEMSLYQSALDLQELPRVDTRDSVHSEHVPLSSSDVLQDIVEEEDDEEQIRDAASITLAGQPPMTMISKCDKCKKRVRNFFPALGSCIWTSAVQCAESLVSCCLCRCYKKKREVAERVAAKRIHSDSLSLRIDYWLMSRDESMYFRDAMRRIDFVLAYSAAVDAQNAVAHAELRKVFEMNLIADGLQLEHEADEGKLINFVKIHAPWEVLSRYAEIMKLKMPMRELPESYLQAMTDMSFLPELERPDNQPTGKIIHEVESLRHKMTKCLQLDQTKFPPRDKRFTYEYSREKEYLFDIPPIRDEFFSPSNRSLVVDFILKRNSFSREKTHDISAGIVKLLAEGVYTGCYRLHEGELENYDSSSPRGMLKAEWASLCKIHKLQPLDHIKDYLGVRFGLYFAWLGFYTYMLIPASIVGLICFIYGCVTMYSFTPSQDICTIGGNITMCPICDKLCHYWKLNETCIHSRITYLFDNPSTVVFAIFMSFWSTLFLEMWKRYSATITYRWDLTGFDQGEEHPRPEYLSRLAKQKKQVLSLITTSEEPKLSYWKVRVPAILMSSSIILLLIIIALVAVIAVIFYRMSVLTALAVHYSSLDRELINRHAPVITTATAALINLLCILILNQVYSKVAELLTELEMHRTQTEYDDSLTLKMFLLQFINYYASIFYIAFFKGKFIGHPGKYNRFFGYRQEECGPGGCLMELSIQLAIIMIGKQAMNTLIEMGMPKFWKYYHAIQNKISSKKEYIPQNVWEKDFFLVQWPSFGLFWEYLEMVLQFGFVTIFVAAFPLAPLFALMNNAFEMRLDANKILLHYRRPTPHRVKNIGIWYKILDGIGKLAVITNAFIIAFTSQYIPRMVYTHFISKDSSLNGYLDYSLSYFNISNYPAEYMPENPSIPIKECRYEDYREKPLSSDGVPYDLTPYFWHVLAARLAFVVVFENFVVLFTTLIRWIIPDIPYRLQDTMRKEAYVINQMIVQYEFLRSKGGLQKEKYSAKSLARQANLFMELKHQEYESPNDGSNSLRKRPTTESIV